MDFYFYNLKGEENTWTVRLSGGTSEAGRLEILFEGQWNTVCYNKFGMSEMKGVCKMLGFNSTGQAVVRSLIFGAGSGLQFKYVKCQGTETSLEH